MSSGKRMDPGKGFPLHLFAKQGPPPDAEDTCAV